MSAGAVCRECGAAILAGSPGGLCGKCAFALSVEAELGTPESQDEAQLNPISDSESKDQSHLEAGSFAGAIGPLSEKPGDRIGRYRLLQQIGEGGFGVVYMAQQLEPVKRRVALKIIKLGMDTKQVVARFEAERQALALMDHPNIAKVLDAGATANGRPYFVMELVRGIKITDYCDQDDVPMRERLDLFVQICRAVQHAHQKGLIHRDLKPSNILVTSNDGVPVPKIIDFGIAKATQAELTEKTVFTEFGHFIGTPSYMSPEQAQMSGLDIDTRSDIYSLGVLLYELLTGKTPFDSKELLAAGLEAMRRTIQEKKPPTPSTRLARDLAASHLRRLNPSATPKSITEEGLRASSIRLLRTKELIKALRGDLDWIIMKCLEKDRRRRYETANGLASDVQRHLNNEPVTARPPSKLYEFQKTVRRHKIGFIATAAVIAALLLGLVTSTWQAQRAGKAESEQRHLRTEAEQSRNRLSLSVYRMEMSEIQRAEEWFAAGENPKAIAHLASVLRQTPTNRVAAQRLMSALTELHFARPALPPLQHAGRLTWAQFSHRGRLIVTTSADATARVWDAHTGQPVAGPLQHAQEVNMADFSPDDRFLVTASQDKTARVWDLRTGQPVSPPLLHEDDICNAHFSPDSRWIVTASADHTARVWDARTGKARFAPLRCGDWITEAEFSPDGTRVLTASKDYTARVWDATTGMLLVTLGHGDFVTAAHFSPDGQRMLTASDDGTAQLWDTYGHPISPRLQHDSPIRSAEFSPDGLRIVTSTWNGTTRVWDTRTGQLACPPLRHRDRVRSARFSPDGLRVVTASEDQTARVWDARTGEPITQPFREGAHVFYAEFDPQGRRVLTASNGTAAHLWDIDPLPISTTTFTNIGVIGSVDFNPDGTRLVTASRYQTLVWETKTGQRVMQLGNQGANFAAYSPDGKWIVTATANYLAQVWNAQTGAPVGASMVHSNIICYASFSPDGRRVATASLDGTARIWDARRGQPLTQPLLHPAPVADAQFSPDGRRLLTASGRSITIWDTLTGQPLFPPLPHSSEVKAARFSGDGQRIIVRCRDSCYLWDARAGQRIAELPPMDAPSYAGFLGAGQRAVTCSEALQLWDAQTGKLVRTFSVGCGFAQLSADGQRLVGAVQKNTRVRFWDFESGLPLDEGFQLPNDAMFLKLSPDGQRVLTASAGSDVMATLWELPVYSVLAPPWVPELAEALAGQRVDVEGRAEFVPCERVLQIRQELERNPREDSYGRWAKWFFAKREPPAPSPADR